MATYSENWRVQWFEGVNPCRSCGKEKATGILRGIQNESFGFHCKPCADRRIKAAMKVREQIAKEPAHD